VPQTYHLGALLTFVSSDNAVRDRHNSTMTYVAPTKSSYAPE